MREGGLRFHPKESGLGVQVGAAGEQGQIELRDRLWTHASWSLAAAPPRGTQRAGRHPHTWSPSPPCTRGYTPPAQRLSPGAGSHSSTPPRPPGRHRCRTCRESGVWGESRPEPRAKAEVLMALRSRSRNHSWVCGQDEGWDGSWG